MIILVAGALLAHPIGVTMLCFQLTDPSFISSLAYERDIVKRKKLDAKCIFCVVLLTGMLPDFGKRHLGIEIFKTGFVSSLHSCQLGKEQLLLGVC